MDAELRFHMETYAADLVRSGVAPEEAMRRARIEFGGIDRAKEECREARGVHFIETLAQDIRYGLRTLRKSPGFTVVALLTLALGIGANTAIFSLLNAVMLKSLPVQEPEHLVLFGSGRWAGSTRTLPDESWHLFSYPFYREISDRNDVFSGIAAVHSIEFSAHCSVGGGSFELVNADLVSGTYFSVLGLRPILGRTLTEADDQTPGSGPVAVASYSWWKRRFANDPSILGKTVKFESTVYTIVGVAPPEFFGATVGESPDLWIPLSMEKEISPGWNGLDDKFFQSLYLMARLKPGVTVAQASANTNFLFKQILRSEYVSPQASSKELDAIEHARIDLTSAARGLSPLRRQFSSSLEILMAVVVLVLLIACINIANLLLARGTARAREIAMRMALGASRERLIRQLATESFLVALFGAVLGLAFAWNAPHLLFAMVSGGSTRTALQVAPDLRVLLFTLLVALLAAILFGVAPALRATRFELTSSLKDGRSATSSRARSPLARALLVSQIALSLALLAGTGLFLRTLMNLAAVDTGFDKQNVLVFDLDFYAGGYKPDARLDNLFKQIEGRVDSVHGVSSSSFSMFTFNQGEWSDSVTLEGIAPTSQNTGEVLFNRVGPGFFSTMGLPVLAGRSFGSQDTPHSPRVAVINETMARQFFPGQSPLGHRFRILDDADQRDSFEIIGVVKNAKYQALREQPEAAAYSVSSQDITYLPNFAVRFSGDAAQVIPAVRRAIQEVANDVPIGRVTTLAEQVDDSIQTQRLVARLTAFFGVLAVFLVCIGTYGLMSYSVARRTNEIGVRMALGAERANILAMILREGLLLTALGLLIGLVASLGLTRLLSAFLFGVRPGDPLTFGAATMLLVAVTLAACYVPARRAMRVDPMIALRHE